MGQTTNFLLPYAELADPADANVATKNLAVATDAALTTVRAGAIATPPGIQPGEAMVWNGTTWARSTITLLGPSSIGAGARDGTKFLRDDGTWVGPIPAGSLGTGVRDGTKFLRDDGVWATAAPDPATLAMAGVIWEFGGAVAPTGWVLCDGAAYPRVGTMAALFAAIQTRFGAGDGSTTFNVPDYRGRVGVGYAASGGNGAVDTVGKNEGVPAANRRPHHRHTPHTHAGTYDSTPGAGYPFGSGINVSNLNAIPPADGGSGVATDPLDAPAYLVVNKIIKF